MSRDEILTRLYSLGAISLVRDIQEIEAGRVRRIALPPRQVNRENLFAFNLIWQIYEKQLVKASLTDQFCGV